MQHLSETAGATVELGDTVKVFFERRGGVVDYEVGCVVKCQAHEENIGGEICIRMDKPVPEEFAVLRIDIFDPSDNEDDKP